MVLCNLTHWSHDQVFRRDSSSLHLTHDSQLVRPVAHCSAVYADLILLPTTSTAASSLRIGVNNLPNEAHQPIEAHGCGSPPGMSFPPLSHAFKWCLVCAKQLWCWQVFRRAESDLRRSRPAGQGIDRNTSGKSDTVVASPDTAPSLARMDNSEVLLPLAALQASGAVTELWL